MNIIEQMLERLAQERVKFINQIDDSIRPYPDIVIKGRYRFVSNSQVSRTMRSSNYDVSRCYMKWTKQEEYILRRDFLAGRHPRELAKRHKRTLGAINSRLSLLSLITFDGKYRR